MKTDYVITVEDIKNSTWTEDGTVVSVHGHDKLEVLAAAAEQRVGSGTNRDKIVSLLVFAKLWNPLLFAFIEDTLQEEERRYEAVLRAEAEADRRNGIA
jgi:hypothetical protein